MTFSSWFNIYCKNNTFLFIISNLIRCIPSSKYFKRLLELESESRNFESRILSVLILFSKRFTQASALVSWENPFLPNVNWESTFEEEEKCKIFVLLQHIFEMLITTLLLPLKPSLWWVRGWLMLDGDFQSAVFWITILNGFS